MKDKGHYIKTKRLIHQEKITVINIYAPNIGGPTYLKQIFIELRGEKNAVL